MVGSQYLCDAGIRRGLKALAEGTVLALSSRGLGRQEVYVALEETLPDVLPDLDEAIANVVKEERETWEEETPVWQEELAERAHGSLWRKGAGSDTYSGAVVVAPIPDSLYGQVREVVALACPQCGGALATQGGRILCSACRRTIRLVVED